MGKAKKRISHILILVLCLSMLIQCSGAVSASEDSLDGGGKSVGEYSVILEKAEHGLVKFEDSEENRLFFKKGDMVQARIEADPGYRLEKAAVLEEETEEEIPGVEWRESDKLTFAMPDRDVLIRCEFAAALEEMKEEKESAGAAEETKEPMQAAGNRVFVARARHTSSQLKEKIGKVKLCRDNGEERKTYNEGMLGVDGSAAYCLDPLVNFESGDVTPVELSDCGLSKEDVTTCALYIKYIYEYSELSVEQKYLAAQCLIWRYLSGIFGLDCGGTHVDGSDFNLERQEQIYSEIKQKIPEGKKKYVGEGTAYLNGSTQPVAQFSLRPVQGYLRLTKTSARPELTDGNTCYSLEGAQYGVYEDKGCTRLAALLTTDAGGKSNTISLKQGTYYVKEVQAPRGYLVDSQVYSVKVEAASAAEVNVSDEPVKDLSAITIYKIDKGTKSPDAEGAASLENSLFKVNFYAGYYTRDNLPAKATRSWILKARTLDSVSARQTQELEEYEKVSGDPFYKEGDTIILPLGTLSIEEAGAPLGYILDPVYLPVINGSVENIEKAEGIYVSQITQNGSKAALDGGNTYAAGDSVIRGDFSLTKIDRNTQTPMERVRFRITSDTTGESHVFTTDANGHYSSSSDYVAHSYHTNQGNVGDGLWFGMNEAGESAAVDDLKGALPYDTYTLEELKCDANQGKYLYKGKITITKDQYIVNLGNIENADVAVWTTAKDEETGTHYAQADSDVTIIDTVEYIGLQKGKSYRLNAVLMNRSTGTAVLNKNNEAVTVSKNFTPKDSNGTVEMEIFFDASDLQGADVVVFEELYLKDEKLAEHKDLNDSSQTVHFPGIATQAIDRETNSEMSKADDEITIVDTVSYENLREGRKYTVTGILMDKETKKAALDKNGNKIEAKTDFTAESPNGTVEVVFRFDGSGLGGKTLVAFETLEKDRREYALHRDIDDEAQTIFIPKIGTQACDEDTKMHISRADSEVELIDEVKYENLAAGKTYVLKGTLVDQKTKKEVVDAAGDKITAQTTFTPKERDGSVEVVFRFDGSHLAGESVVVYEELWYNDESIAEHKAIDDENQTIYFPELKTTAADKDTELQISYAGRETTIEDVVHYKNLIAGKKYTVQGILTDKDTGEAILDEQGEAITAETEFKAKDTAGEVKVVFQFDGSVLAGRTVVACEELFIEKKSIAVHADLDDEAQTVRFPKIQTQAADRETGNNLALASDKITVTDTVSYQHLVTDQQYRLEGVLMDKATLEPARGADGKEIRADMLFTPEEPDGTVELTFEFPGRGTDGHTFVIFEELSLRKSWFKEVTVAIHKDIQDEAQSIHIPKVRTAAIDDETKTHQSKADGAVHITDTVSYSNLLPGYRYTLKGILMDKETGGKILDADGKIITSETTFEAEEPDGEIEMRFGCNGGSFAGKTVVVFETLFCEDKQVAGHEDIEDADQSIYFPEIKTNAVGKPGKGKEITAQDKVTITDRVAYKNLLKGHEYKVVGTIMDKSTGEALPEEGNPITAECIFTPEETSGNIEVDFTLNGRGMEGKELVIFEKLYMTENNEEIAVHEDIEDKDQTVRLVAPSQAVKTGDTVLNLLVSYLILFIISGGILTKLKIKKR